MSLNKKIRRQIRKMPKYKIQEEAFQSQNIARTRAFGRDRDIQMEREDITQGAEEATSRAQDVSSSTSDLLSTIATIEAARGQNIRGLAKQEMGQRTQNVSELYAANQMMIDEKDKAWRQNVYAPWEARLRGLKERKANRANFWSNIAGGALTAAGSVLGGPIGGAIAGGVAKGITNRGQEASQYGQLDDASLYGYNPYMRTS